MNLHASIRCEYGQESVKLVREYEKSALKHARFRNHLHFNLHCKHNGIIPVSLRLQSNVQGKKADNILRRAERSLLSVRIGQTVQKVKKIEAEVSSLERRISTQLPEDEHRVKEFVTASQAKEFQQVKERQQKKFERMTK